MRRGKGSPGEKRGGGERVNPERKEEEGKERGRGGG